jgi:hypothetical protein
VPTHPNLVVESACAFHLLNVLSLSELFIPCTASFMPIRYAAMPLRGLNLAAYRGALVPEGSVLTAQRHIPYLPVSRQMPKCPFGTLRESGQPIIRNGG